MIKKCLICKKEFRTYRCLVKKGYGKYCSHKCFIEATKQGKYPKRGYQKGHPQYNTGRTHFKKGFKHTEKWKKEMSERMEGNTWGFQKGKNVGSKHHNWKGGIIIYDNRCFILTPEHPRNHKGYARRSHLIAEKYLGRYIADGEVIHHINGNSLDDNPENLYLFLKKEHDKFHLSKSKSKLKSNLHH
ncbi:MAG TPA: hypothetical protein ENH85_02810 [Candidatus Scalindua sp.]|nr:hypothetical protein [Candidatus Scalindua sp.]